MDLSKIFKAYDVRGLYPGDFDAAAAKRIGAAYARWLADNGRGTSVLIAGDMRPTTPEVIEALAAGITEQGSDAIVAGLSATDQLYFAAGWQDRPGIMVTASHNPAAYNGLKFCLAKAAPVGLDTGLADVRDLAERGLPPAPRPGVRTELDTLEAYVRHLHTLVSLAHVRPLKVVVDAGNGMAGHTVPAVFASTSIEIVPMYFELDGTFPNHPADPLNPDNLVDLQAEVVRQGADLGLAFDGDADRCFVVDERGAAVSPSAITAMIASRELVKHPGGAVVYNVITSRAVAEIVREGGGVPVRGKVGHSNMKASMAQHQAIFGGEHSAHYYFREFWNADTGMLAALHVLAELGRRAGPLSEVVAPYDRYVASGEINSTVEDLPGRIAAVTRYADAQGDATYELFDGITVTFTDGAWFNVRASNTEPLLRLNVEASGRGRMEKVRDHVLSIIRGG